MKYYCPMCGLYDEYDKKVYAFHQHGLDLVPMILLQEEEDSSEKPQAAR